MQTVTATNEPFRDKLFRFRGGLVFKAHRLVYHSTLGWGAIEKRRRRTVTATNEPFREKLAARAIDATRVTTWFRVQGSGSRVQGSGFRVQGSGFRVQGSGFRVQGSGSRFRVPGFWFGVWGFFLL